MRFGRSLDRSFGPTNRLRTEGTDALLAAAGAAGVRRFVAQSFASYRYARVGGPVKTEDDPLDPDPPAMARETNAAMAHLDQAVTDAGGIALRYGGFYGAASDGLIGPVRKRQFPVIGATVLALEADAAGLYNMVMMADGSRGASNARARRELGWTPRYPSWRQGFPAVYGSRAGAQ